MSVFRRMVSIGGAYVTGHFGRGRDGRQDSHGGQVIGLNGLSREQ